MTFQSAESTRVSLGRSREVSRAAQRLWKHRAFFSAVQHRPEALPTPFVKTASLARIFSALAVLAICVGVAQAQNAVTVGWNPVTNGSVSSYNVYQGTKSGSYSLSTNVGSLTQARLTGLASGAQYYFAVTAVNSAGESPYSTEIAYTGPAVTNGVPTNSPPPTNSLPSTNSVPTNSLPATNLVPAGLVASFGFEEGSGSTTADQSGKGNNGSINGATWVAGGKFGKALSFNGSSSYVQVADASSLDLASGMTLEAWVNPTVLNYWHEIIYKGDDAYYLEGGTPATAGPAVGIGASSASTMLSAPSKLPLNTWTHVAGTYDGTTLRMYVNGALVASKPQATPISASTLPLTIGADTLHGSHFAGMIDEVRVYNRALSATELQQDMATAVTSVSTNPTAPPAALQPLPPQWSTRDIGNVGISGTAGTLSGAYVVVGAGALQGSADAFRFVYQPLNGNGQITAQVVSDSVSLTNGLMGVMIRESLTPGSRHAFIGFTSKGYATAHSRTTTGGNETPSTATGSPATPPKMWVRLVRKQYTFSAYQSVDGTNWTLFKTLPVTMAKNAYAGLVVTSGNTSSLNNVTFTNLGGVQ